METEDRIHIALSPWDLTDDYNRHAGVTLLSLLEHSTKPVTAHLLYDEKLCIGKEKETDYNRTCYQKIADKYNCCLEFHHVELPSWIFKMSNVMNWTPGTLLRLCLPTLLPSVDKILYIDCDFVVQTDVSLLWNLNLTEYPLAACYEDLKLDDSRYKKRIRYYKKNNVPIDSYFNAGFMLLNLKNLRLNDFSNKIFEYMHNHLDLPYLDQDALNWFCHGDYLRLETKYDVMNWLDNPLDFNGDCNIHYGFKPWKEYHGLSDMPYWEYLLKTPWCSDLSYFLSYVHLAPDYSKVMSFRPKNLIALLPGSPIEKAKSILNFTFSLLVSSIGEFIRNHFFYRVGKF